MRSTHSNIQPIEVWGGVECTVTRIKDKFPDQIKKTGHNDRLEDLDLIASLGIKTVRYPVLWERVAPKSLKSPDWSWTDERLYKLKELGIKPIAGLLHHGSGPNYCCYSESSFPEMFTEYACMVAERYPWIEYYTPVNEPLTTARFGGLYGLWYPHKRDNNSFSSILLNEMKATIKAMHAIRAVNPNAGLIQTEDLGKTHSTKELAYQANFENERRWLTYDLLTGKLNPGGKMWKYFLTSGIKEDELNYFIENTFEPSVCGFNYYVTSERYLDQNLKQYPLRYRGGNGKHPYADVEAVRVGPEEPFGFYKLLKEAAERYKLPIALTEVHLACTREEQVRWFLEAYHNATRLKDEGYDFRAITAWAAFGSCDWDNLLRRNAGHYEPGVFDIRSNTPRPTAIADVIRKINLGEKYKHPLAEVGGWWKRPVRQLYSSPGTINKPVKESFHNFPGKNPLLIAGGAGTLGKAIARICDVRGLPYRLLSRKDMDIASANSVREVIKKYTPWAIINAAGYVKVDEAELEQEICFRENTLGPSVLAGLCVQREIKLVTFSSDLVFDGSKDTPYTEYDATAPLSIYGKSKVEAENLVLDKHPDSLIIRTSSFFGPWDEYNFLYFALQSALSGVEFPAANDIFISPTYVPDLVQATLDLMIDDEKGIWHLTNKGKTSWYEFASAAVRLAKLDEKLIVPVKKHQLGNKAKRPSYSVLASAKTDVMSELNPSLIRFFNKLPLSWRSMNKIKTNMVA